MLMIAFNRIFVLTLLSCSFFIMLELVDFAHIRAQQQKSQLSKLNPLNKCIKYDAAKMMIIIRCESATLTDVYNQLKNTVVLSKQPNGVWDLNANITINPGAMLTIDPKDTTWLKIITDEKSLSYGIHVKGSENRWGKGNVV